uniref:CCAAT-binding factor domain-containing protein n=1 Tax=Panagrolaimus sp. JU765 TaxID=591449 RepID=A0AC34QBD5_9BILA
MEHDLKKIEAAESLATKLKYATDTMKHVFLIYFRVIRRMATTKLLGPVLAGLSKFAHLINIEFFDDLIESLEGLLDLQHLSVIDSLNCVKTVFIVLSGEGLALNIDPYKFYRCMYRIIPSIPFEKSEKSKDERIEVLVESIVLMLNRRKKQVSLVRVAAYVKVLLAICFMLSTRHCAAVLACLRSLFISFPGLLRMVEEDTDVVMNGVYRPEVADPDICNALASSALPELRRLSKHPDSVVLHYANNILNGCPSTGANRLKAEWVTIAPSDWISSDLIETSRPSPFLEQLKKAAQKRKAGLLSSKNLCSTVEFWLRD